MYFRRSSAEAGGIARRTSMDDDTDVAMGATLEDALSGGEIEDGECGNY